MSRGQIRCGVNRIWKGFVCQEVCGLSILYFRNDLATYHLFVLLTPSALHAPLLLVLILALLVRFALVELIDVETHSRLVGESDHVSSVVVIPTNIEVRL